jgi:hypothetical protein
MRRGLNKDILGGAILVVLGLFVAWHARSSYDLGTLRRMGPGFLPLVLGLLLAALGFLIVLAGLVKTRATVEQAAPLDGRGAAFVLGGIVAFGLLLPVAGLILTSFVSGLIMLFPDRKFTPLAKLATAAGLAVLSYLIFILGLRMNLMAWPWR